MNVYEPRNIRNVLLVGHSGAGKTTLLEAMLFAAGATNRMGRIEDGNTVSDHDPEEVRRGISVSLSMANFGPELLKRMRAVHASFAGPADAAPFQPTGKQ